MHITINEPKQDLANLIDLFSFLALHECGESKDPTLLFDFNTCKNRRT